MKSGGAVWGHYIVLLDSNFMPVKSTTETEILLDPKNTLKLLSHSLLGKQSLILIRTFKWYNINLYSSRGGKTAEGYNWISEFFFWPPILKFSIGPFKYYVKKILFFRTTSTHPVIKHLDNNFNFHVCRSFCLSDPQPSSSFCPKTNINSFGCITKFWKLGQP